MALSIYNSLSRKTEEFTPLESGKVKMYVCGPTVYNYLHVGNFRGPVVFNMVRNWLEELGFEVFYALNFTDVDDKIIQRAQSEGVDPYALSEKYIAEYKTDFAALGLKPHNANPKVTEHMSDIITMVEDLIKNKKAYVAQGDVLYSINAFPEYGKLSGRNVDELIAGARVDVDEKKDNPMDFALWKAAKSGEPSWASPWGPGRPGWHIECSAMNKALFGDSIDIHGGGMDLIFPHHENEVAQSEGCTGHQFARYWMHNNMLNFGGQKMSKSLGNIVTMREFLQTHPAELYKFMILSVHYRTVCDFSEEAITRALSPLARIYSALSLAESVLSVESVTPERDPAFEKMLQEAWTKIQTAMNDDFGTPLVFAALFDLVRAFNSQIKRGGKVTAVTYYKAQEFRRLLLKVGRLFSLFQEPATEFLKKLDDYLLKGMNLDRHDIQSLVDQRSEARKTKDWGRSDELRQELTAKGIAVMDVGEVSFWEVVK